MMSKERGVELRSMYLIVEREMVSENEPKDVRDKGD
jgi:hypothetical protein